MSEDGAWGRHQGGAGLSCAVSAAAGGLLARRISVRPIAAGWCVQGDRLEPLVFARGGHAERQARSLARGFARLGRDAQVNVHDARDRLAGCISYFGVAAGCR